MCMVVIFAIKKRLEFLKRFIYNLNIELHLKKKVNFTGKVGQGVLQQVEMIGFMYKHLQYFIAFSEEFYHSIVSPSSEVNEMI